MKKKILIVGANFQNKGAQSMLFVTVDEIKKRVRDCDVFFAGYEEFDKNVYNFQELYFSENAKKIALEDHVRLLKIKCWLKDCLKYFLGKRINLWRFNEVNEEIKDFSLIIDVSGFILGKKWSAEIQEVYLNNIRLAKKYKIPMVIMPQSFGPFDYPEENAFLLKEMQELLEYPKIIFAREKDSYKNLVDQFHLTNVKLSTDLVLQNKGVDITNIYKKMPSKVLPNILDNAVAVVPNKQCFNHGDTNKNLQLYKMLIEHLLKKGKVVYVFRHSKEDFPICKMIAELFSDEKVILLDNEFSCLEYDKLIKRFEFIVCSRFHGVVHAYRNYIPCILIGWAIKYQELATNVGQDQYAFDITSPDFSAEKVMDKVDEMLTKVAYESKTIKKNVLQIQKQNCFDQIVRWL